MLGQQSQSLWLGADISGRRHPSPPAAWHNLLRPPWAQEQTSPSCWEDKPPLLSSGMQSGGRCSMSLHQLHPGIQRIHPQMSPGTFKAIKTIPTDCPLCCASSRPPSQIACGGAPSLLGDHSPACSSPAARCPTLPVLLHWGAVAYLHSWSLAGGLPGRVA